MVDSIKLEKCGIPVAAICTEKFASTTARAMAKMHRWPDYPFVVLPENVSELSDVVNINEVVQLAEVALPQVEHILTSQLRG